MMPPGVQSKIDAQLQALYPTIEADENAYHAANGRYWQGLITHSTLPADGTDVLPDVGDLTPTDQPDPWPLTLIDDPVAMAMIIDAYDGPRGLGYVLTALVTITPPGGGQQPTVRWQRALNVGPETERGYDWIGYEEGQFP